MKYVHYTEGLNFLLDANGSTTCVSYFLFHSITRYENKQPRYPQPIHDLPGNTVCTWYNEAE